MAFRPVDAPASARDHLVERHTRSTPDRLTHLLCPHPNLTRPDGPVIKNTRSNAATLPPA